MLQHILNRIGMQQKELSQLTGILPQHINSLIKGTRRFSVSSSLAIEDALGIDTDGLLYKCQCNFDISQAKKDRQRKPDLTKLRKTTFWDVDLEKIDWQKGKRWAILRVLEYGCQNDFDEIAKLYGRNSFISEINRHSNDLSPAILNNANLFGLIKNI